MTTAHAHDRVFEPHGFIETNYRKLEIDQSFSLSQIDPQALIRQKETGECDFTLAEIFLTLRTPVTTAGGHARSGSRSRE